MQVFILIEMKYWKRYQQDRHPPKGLFLVKTSKGEIQLGEFVRGSFVARNCRYDDNPRLNESISHIQSVKK